MTRGKQVIPLIAVFLLCLHCSSFTTADSPTFPAVHRLQQYLQIRTDHGPPDYEAALSFLNRTFTDLLPSAKLSRHEFVSGKPILIATIQGTQPDIPSILLNSHTDVVPAEPEKWSRDPWAAEIVTEDDEERLYGRGTQDMKSIGLQYVEALSLLIKSGWAPTRTIHVSFVPDEEIGGENGMGQLVKSDLWKKLNIGFALDEGMPSESATYNIFQGERQTWWVAVNVQGSPGHGSTMPENTASQTLHGIIGNALEFRKGQFKKLSEEGASLGDVIGVNLVYTKSGTPDPHLESGFVMNMVPSVASAGFDIRVPPAVDPLEMDRTIESWMHCSDGEICAGVSYKYILRVTMPEITSLDSSEWYMSAFLKGLGESGVAESEVRKGIFVAATDARYVRHAGVPSIGFSPIKETANLLHKHNEYISVSGYLAGFDVYKALIKNLADTILGKEGLASDASEKQEL